MGVQKTAVEDLKSACGIFLQQLLALPEETFGRSFGPATRTITDMVYEVNLVNDHIGMIIRSEEPFVLPEGAFIRAPEGFDAEGVVIAAFRELSDRAVATVASFSSEELDAPL